MKPIPLNAEMVRAILNGRKTQTWRVIPQKVIDKYDLCGPGQRGDYERYAPYRVGDANPGLRGNVIKLLKCEGDAVVLPRLAKICSRSGDLRSECKAYRAGYAIDVCRCCDSKNTNADGTLSGKLMGDPPQNEDANKKNMCTKELYYHCHSTNNDGDWAPERCAFGKLNIHCMVGSCVFMDDSCCCTNEDAHKGATSL